MNTLEEAIQHCAEIVEKHTDSDSTDCKDGTCAADHLQLMEWLSELRMFRKWYRKWFYDSEGSNYDLKFLNLRNILDIFTKDLDKNIVKIEGSYKGEDKIAILTKLRIALQDCKALLTRITNGTGQGQVSTGDSTKVQE